MRKAWWSVLVMSCFSSAQLAAQEADVFQDAVSTLPLSRELDSRGNLGGVSVDRLGFVYVANFRDSVWKISPEGEVATLTRSLYGASGNALDSRGDLYQANFYGNTITRITRTGEISTFAAEGLSGPVGIAVDAQDNLFVCNCTGNTLVRISSAGRVERFAESEHFACPNGITLDDRQNLYVTNFNSHEVVKVTAQGEVSRFTTIPGGAGNAHIVFSKGFFYVTKIIANRVVKVSAAGEVFPLAGTGQPGSQDGPALESSWFRPNGIAVSPQGDHLYVNTLVGEYSKPQPSSMQVRTIQLVTLTRLLEKALEAEGLEAAKTLYQRYKKHSIRGKENTLAEMIALGYSLLSGRKTADALQIFRLNAASYPEKSAARFHLGEAFRYLGQPEQAMSEYRAVLELDPDHRQAAARLDSLRNDPK